MSLSYIILGLLHENDYSGYDLNKQFQSATPHFWTTEQSQIYRALYKLVERGWITYETVVQDDAPNKKVYAITASGAEELQRWLVEPHEDRPPPQTWLAQIYFADLLTRDQAMSLISKQLERLQQRLAAYQSLRDMLNQQNSSSSRLSMTQQVRLLILEHSIMVIQSEIAYIEQLAQKLQEVATTD